MKFIHFYASVATAMSEELEAARVTVAYTLTNRNKLKYGVSFCSTADQFSRARGRTIATGRFAKRSTNVELPLRDYTEEEVIELLRQDIETESSEGPGDRTITGMPSRWTTLKLYTPKEYNKE